MKIKHIRVLLMLAAMIISCSNMANAQSLKDLLGKLGGSGDTSETIGNLLEGVFSSSNLSVQDLKGNWLATGPAVALSLIHISEPTRLID